MTDAPTGSWDYALAYRELRGRIIELVRSRPDAVDEIVPTTPEWRARDTVAHLAGICDDIVNGNLAGVGTDEWTAAQVDKRRDWDLDVVIDDWDANATAVEALFEAFPPSAAGQMLSDAATHEHDLRGLFGAPGARDATALIIGFEWGTDVIGERLESEGAGSVRFETEAGAKSIGAGDPISTVRSSRFEVVRALTGRRSLAQMRALDGDGPFDREGLLLAPVFTPAAHDILE